jgi:hypothetical protein
MALWDRDNIERHQANHALSLGVVRELTQHHMAIINLSITKITGSEPLEAGSHDEAFRVGYVLATGISSIATMLNTVIIAYGDVAGGRWREQTREIINALTLPADASDPVALLRERGRELTRADKLLGTLEAVLRQRALATSLGSGELASDEDFRALLD